MGGNHHQRVRKRTNRRDGTERIELGIIKGKGKLKTRKRLVCEKRERKENRSKSKRNGER